MASLSLTFTHSTHNQRFASGLQEVEVFGEKIWVLGGEGFGTERARLAQGGFSEERARLAQGKFLPTEDQILLGTKFQKSRFP